MNQSQRLLSDIVVYTKYAKYIPELKRRESWNEICNRYEKMMVEKYPHLTDEIISNMVFIRNKQVLMSMRAAQFAGQPITKNNSRIFNCFGRETKFITACGVKSFVDFSHGDETMVLTHTGQWKKAIVKNYGKQKLNLVTFSKGKSKKQLRVTSNHRWILKDGSYTTSLKVGDVIYEAPDFISDFDWDDSSPEQKLAWCYGFVYGDGSILKNRKGEYTHSMLRLCGDDVKYTYRFEELGFSSSSPRSVKGDVIVYTGKYLKTLPEISVSNFDELLAFVVGYLDADGYKNYTPSNRSKYKGIQASGKESIDFIEKAFEMCSMYIMSYDDLTGQETNYGIRSETKRFRMNHVISKYSNAMWSVSSIDDKAYLEEDVWCLEVEDDHSFVLSGGIVTGNCAYLPIDDYRAFAEIMFLLLGGTGVGYSVQFAHINKLPEIKIPRKKQKFLIGDSIEGWADAIRALMAAFFGLRSTLPVFDFSDIRPKGARLVTAGGKAPGPEPLKRALFSIQTILERKQDGDKLSSLECHDIVCHIADAVLAGGIRRAALISLFSADDEDMITAKAGNWWELNPQRGRANNSAVLVRHRATKEFFMGLWAKMESSGSGEPGVFFSNNSDWGTNPCCLPHFSNILTTNGYLPIGDLVNNNQLRFINKNGDEVDGFVWKTGEKEVFKVKAGNTKDPFIIYGTHDHRFMTSTGDEVQLRELLNRRLMTYVNYNTSFNIDEVRYGFILGDGSFRKDATLHKNIQCSFTPVKDDQVKKLFNKTGWSDDETSYTVDVSFEELSERGIDTTLRTFDRMLPTIVTPSFLTGLYSANGSVVANSRVSYKTTSKTLAQQLTDCLRGLDIEAYITTNKAKDVVFSNGTYTCKESYDVNITNLKDLIKFAEKINFVQSYKQEALQKAILDKSPYVFSIESIGVQPVYDFTLYDDTHWGVVDGIITHNCEISLRPFQFCNLTEINGGVVDSQETFNQLAKVASFFGTLQAGFTDFHYLRNIWRSTTEKDALIGVGITGIANGRLEGLDLAEASKAVTEENERVAKLIGINKAARTTTIKPSGTTSCVVGTSSGIHAWHSEFYIRNIQCAVGDDLYNFFTDNHPDLIKVMDYDPRSAVIACPQMAPVGAILRDNEGAIDLLERVKRFKTQWINPGHRSGDNTNNVSATISIKPNEWDEVGEWMWANRQHYNGLSVLPFDGGTYKDAPFQSITAEEYAKREINFNIDLTQIMEENDNTAAKDELACAGNACEITL